jgi:triosephosphate isomerase (TIM)
MHAERAPLLAANWKLNQDWESCQQFIERLQALRPDYFDDDVEPVVDLLICPPAPYLALLGSLLEDAVVFLGGQDCSRYAQGAYTGEISAAMLNDVGCDYCILGHSERRHIFGDTGAVIAERLAQVRAAEMLPILCVGEPLAVRDAGQAVEYTLGQLDEVLAELRQFDPGHLVIAYEPVWAIGTGRNAEPADAQAMAAAIRGWLKDKLGAEQAALALILYGGSVKPENCAGYFAAADIDGALVGGASLAADSLVGLAEEIEKQLVAADQAG